MATGKEQKITVTASSGLSEDDIKKMVEEAEAHAEEDKRRKEEIELKNQLDGFCYSVEKTYNENKDKLPDAQRQRVESALEDAKKAVEDGSIERMRTAMDNLTAASHAMSQVLYQQQAAGGDASTGESAGASESGDGNVEEGEVVDAEYEEKS